MQINDALIVQLTADIKGLQASLNTAGKNVETFSGKAEKDIATIEESLSKARVAVLAFGGAWAAFEAGKQVVEAGMQMQALESRMKAATGNADVAANSMAYVRAEAERLGLSFVTSAEGFAGFAASALRAGLTLDQTKEIFSGVSEAATAMRLPAENVSLVFKALEQMAAKGTVSMEELKGQLGESLPGAFEIAAKAMGVTTAELGELMQKGQVMSADFLPKFAAAVRQEFGASLEDATNGAQAAFNRLENALFEMKARFASAGILDAVTKGVEDLTAAVNDPQVQAGLAAMASLLAQIASVSVQAAAGIGSVVSKANSLIEAAGNKLPLGLGEEIQRQRAQKNGEQTFQQRMIAQTISNFNAQHAPAAPKVSGGYTLGKVAPPSTEAADKAAERARKKAEREAEAARNKAQREAEAQARERESLGSQVRDLGVSMGSEPAQYKAQLEDQQKLLEEALNKRAITKQEFNEMMAATDAAYQEKLQEYVTENFATEAEQETARYEEKQKQLEEALELKLVTEEEYRRMAEELEAEHLENLNDIRNEANEKAVRQQQQGDAIMTASRKQALDSILGFVQVFANKNKAIALAMLAFEKARAVAEILINTEIAAAKALAIYGPTPIGLAAAASVRTMGYISAAAVAATGIAQAAMMASGDKSSGSSGSGGTTFNSSTGQYESNTTGGKADKIQYVNVTFTGRDMSSVPMSEVRELMERFNEASRSGTRLIVSTS